MWDFLLQVSVQKFPRIEFLSVSRVSLFSYFTTVTLVLIFTCFNILREYTVDLYIKFFSLSIMFNLSIRIRWFTYAAFEKYINIYPER